jgi:lipopolysaccharide/colanic/teichoic acid biosynthesis glycosyltransferase
METPTATAAELVRTAAGPSRAQLAVKRTLDVALSALGLMVLSPFLALLALGVKLTSRGPAFFTQERCGEGGRRFRIAKFRTMRHDAHQLRPALEPLNEMDGPVFKMRNDPRCTRFGQWLRRYSLDELPQLWNVLRGEMSLVGPRPPLPEEVERYEPWQLRRLDARPGLTCLWALEGRNHLSFRRWVELDLEYIDRWSLWLDLGILFRTLAMVHRGQGAF